MPTPETTEIKAALLDPDDGESGIVEVVSGRVLESGFSSRRAAADALRKRPALYERLVKEVPHD